MSAVIPKICSEESFPRPCHQMQCDKAHAPDPGFRRNAGKFHIQQLYVALDAVSQAKALKVTVVFYLFAFNAPRSLANGVQPTSWVICQVPSTSPALANYAQMRAAMLEHFPKSILSELGSLILDYVGPDSAFCEAVHQEFTQQIVARTEPFHRKSSNTFFFMATGKKSKDFGEWYDADKTPQSGWLPKWLSVRV